MKLPAINYQLSEKTIKHIEKSTKCSIEELRTVPIDEIKDIMVKRGAIKEPNRIKQWFADRYKKLGDYLGFNNKEYEFYTDID